MIRRLKLALSTLALVALPSLFLVAPAWADYTGDCGSVPASVSGNINISQSGDCTIGYDVTATGYIEIQATGAINTQALTTTGGNNILLIAEGDVATNNLTTGNSSVTGGVEIDAQTGGGNDLFTIGGSGHTNGVNGTISTANTTAGGTDPYFIVGGLFINNGTADSTGGITVSDMSNINVTASASRSGIIILNAQNGTLTLPTGELNADGATGYGAGYIAIMANTVDTADGTVISASQTSGATGTQHNVMIAAETINVTGASGLVVHADGNGVSGSPFTAFADLLAQGSISISSNEEPNSLTWTPDTSGILYTDAAMTVAGTSAPITVTANGLDADVTVAAYPIEFTNGAVTLQSKGGSANEVLVGYYGTTDDANGLTLSGNGAVTFDASSSGGGNDGGSVQIYVDQASISSPSFTVNANGPSSGDGAGGTISLEASELTLDGSTTASVSANAASSGTGNASASAIFFYPGSSSFNVGSGEGEWAFTARGGSTSGNGGTIELAGYSSAVTVYGAGAMTSPIDVSAPGTTGNGGTINLTAYAGLTFDGDDSVLTADSGSTSGNGGQILIQTSTDPVVIGTGSAGDVTLTAISNGSGNGGTVSVISYYGITADTTCISVTAAGDGTGGTITLNADYSELTLDGDLDASGGTGNGQGGSISLTGGYITLADDVNTSLVADGNGSGDAGSISITTNFGDVDVSSDNEALTLEAMSNGSGDGGSLTVNAAGNVDMDGDVVNVTAGTDGNGGNVTVTGSQVTLSNELDADGQGSGTGGNIQFTVTGDTPMDLTEDQLINALGGDSGDGGQVTINNVGHFDVNTVIAVDPEGGSCCVAAIAAKPTISPRVRSGFDGLIALNTKQCQEWLTSDTIEDFTGSWPARWFDCTANKAAPTEADEALITMATSDTFDNLQSVLSGQFTTELYVFTDNTGYGNYWNDSSHTAKEGGFSFHDTGSPRIYVNPWLTGSIGDPAVVVTYSTNQEYEVAAHELGHAVDIEFNNVSFGGTSPDFTNARARDTYDLDNAIVSGSPVTRPNCVAAAGSSDVAPFYGVTDYFYGTLIPGYPAVCQSGALDSTHWMGTFANDNVLNTLEPLWSMYPYYAELYAQVFAYEALQSFGDGAGGARPQFDQVFANGISNSAYFVCMKSFADAALAGNKLPSALDSNSGSCNTAP